MKKSLVTSALLIAVILSDNSFAATPTLYNKPCPKINQIRYYNAKKFTCVKVGKKLLWNRGEDLMATPLAKPVK
jgi:hypothetical protein